MATTEQLEESIRQLREDTTDFWAPLDAVPQVDAHSLSPLEFYRRFVSKSVPVVLLNAMESPQWRHVREHWRDHEYLVSRADDDTLVTVDVTPFGYGDAVLLLDDHNHDDAVFAMPEERTMSLREFFRVFHDRNHDDGVPYLSHQNDSLRGEFPRLYEEVPPCLPLAKEAFGNEPEAVNIWIGDERAVSTMHKDHYENMYCVIKGRKHFTLLPPADVACLYEREFKSVRYRHERSLSGSDTVDVDATAKFHAKYPEHRAWFIVASPGTGDTPWIPVDPLDIDTQTFPLAAQLHPLECVVEEGQVLYLPAMWYHRATQLEPTISVNYWHDMEFDCKYVYYNFVKSLAPSKGPTI